MTGFDFFVDLTVTGTVLGLDHTSTPRAVHRVFGGELDPPLSSFGLVEFGWYEGEVVFFGAQVHRLGPLTRDEAIEPVLVERYGPFPDRVDVDDLRKAVADRGFPLEERPYGDEDHVEFHAPGSHMGVIAEPNAPSTTPTGGTASPPPPPARPAAPPRSPVSGTGSVLRSTAPPPSVACTRGMTRR